MWRAATELEAPSRQAQARGGTAMEEPAGIHPRRDLTFWHHAGPEIGLNSRTLPNMSSGMLISPTFELIAGRWERVPPWKPHPNMLPSNG